MPRGGHDIPMSGTHLKGTNEVVTKGVDPTSSVPFSLLNNLFRPDFSFIYLKWKFFKYSIFFSIFLKISFSRGPFDVRRLEFYENSTISEFNEI